MNVATLIYATAADSALCQDVANSLRGPEFPAMAGVVVEVCDGVVTLRGQVQSFYVSQLLVHGCQRVPRVSGVLDELHVKSGNRLRRARLAE